MPRIQFADLPRAVWEHLLKRIDERAISMSDLLRLQAWARSQPEAPDGEWYKDFGSFLLCGSGAYPKTVLAKGMKPFGKPVE